MPSAPPSGVLPSASADVAQCHQALATSVALAVRSSRSKPGLNNPPLCTFSQLRRTDDVDQRAAASRLARLGSDCSGIQPDLTLLSVSRLSSGTEFVGQTDSRARSRYRSEYCGCCSSTSSSRTVAATFRRTSTAGLTAEQKREPFDRTHARYHSCACARYFSSDIITHRDQSRIVRGTYSNQASRRFK